MGEKSTGKEITITNDKGRLSKDEIKCMVNEAKKAREEDRATQDHVQAKNELDAYAFQMKQTVDDENLKDKISNIDKDKLTTKCDEIINWLEGNLTAKKEEFDHKKKELENVCNPIISKLYRQ